MVRPPGFEFHLMQAESYRVPGVERLKLLKNETHEAVLILCGDRIGNEPCLSGCLPIMRPGESTHRCRAFRK